MGPASDRRADELQRENDDLRASRARVLLAADNERRQMERELHDGPQQQLVALAMNLQRLAQTVGDDTEAALTIVAELRHDVHEALAAMREVGQRIYPPLLLDRGLGDALRAAAFELAVPTTVEIDEMPRARPELAATLYFACVDALRAVADAGAVAIRAGIRPATGALVLDVVADGVDLGRLELDASLSGARDRIDALGGSLAVRTTPAGGVHMSATLSRDP